MMYFRRLFWKDTAERVIATTAQSAIGAVGATAMIQGVDWAIVGGTALLSAVVTFLKCLAAQKIADPDTPSFVDV